MEPPTPEEVGPPPSRRERSGRARPSGARSGFPSLSSRIATTFAGLDARTLAFFALAVLALALGKPAPRMALLEGQGAAAFAVALARATLFTGLKFAPVLLSVVAVSNRGNIVAPGGILRLALTVVVAQAVGNVLSLGAVAFVDPDGYLARFLGPEDPFVVRALRWTGLGMSDLALSATVAGLWWLTKRNEASVARLHRERVDHERAERESAQARLQLMQAQIEPHFLFNALASIRRLYETSPAEGQGMLRQLTRYLASSLPVLRDARPTLGRELTMARAYLDVQRIRMGERLAVAIDVPEWLQDQAVPPMMLATLVENAVIHGLGPVPAGGRIEIRARAESGAMRLEVRDNGRGLGDGWGAGVGLANIRSRLELEYGPRAALEVVDAPGGGVTAVLRIPLPEAGGRTTG